LRHAGREKDRDSDRVCRRRRSDFRAASRGRGADAVRRSRAMDGWRLAQTCSFC